MCNYQTPATPTPPFPAAPPPLLIAQYIKNIERGEQRIQRQQDIMQAIARKLDQYKNPWQVGLG